MIFTFLSSVVNVLGVQKAYIKCNIMYLMKMEELSPLSLNTYTLITNTRTP